jgi:hypothetical protein
LIGFYVKNKFSVLRQTIKMYNIDSFFPDKLKLKKINKKKKLMLNNISAENMLLLNESSDVIYVLSSCNQPNVTNIYTEENNAYYLFALYNRLCIYYIYFPIDLCVLNNKNNYNKILNFSCLLKNFNFLLHINSRNNVLCSISNVYKGFT